MTTASSRFPVTGSGPRSPPPRWRCSRRVGDFDFEEHVIGGAAIDTHGIPLPDATLTACRAADAVFLGAVGGPRWDTTDPAAPRPEQGLLGLRAGLGLFANLRPVRAAAGAVRREPPAPRAHRGHRPAGGARADGRDLLRRPRASTETARTTPCTYTVGEIERIARVAFQAARRRVTSVDKANVLETSRLWREVVERVHGEEFPGVELEHMLVDNAAMQLVARPAQFDVLLTENMFGDILSDEAAMLSGSIGLLPSASLGDGSGPGLFEPVHGSAPDIAGTGAANPLAAISSAALMLRHGLGLADAGAAVESAVDRALEDGLRRGIWAAPPPRRRRRAQCSTSSRRSHQ